MILDLITSVAGGGFIRILTEGVGIFSTMMQERSDRLRDERDHTHQIELMEVEAKNAESIRLSRQAEAEDVRAHSLAESALVEDAKTERATLEVGAGRNWKDSALGALGWTGGFNRILLGVVNFLNGLVRPMVTYWLVGIYGLTVWENVIVRGEDLAPVDMQIIASIIGFWFADRALRKRVREVGRG